MSQARNVTLVRDVIQEEDAGVRSRTVEITRDGKKHLFGVIEIPSFYFDYRSRRAGQNIVQFLKILQKHLNH
jgi:carboxyl-terminal processing protease